MKDRRCLNCGKQFTPASGKQRYCSNRCNQLAYKRERYAKRSSNYVVYVVGCVIEGVKYRKIGITSKINNRLSILQTGCPVQLEVIKIIRCDDKQHALRLEAELHQSFKNYVSINEWFKLH